MRIDIWKEKKKGRSEERARGPKADRRKVKKGKEPRMEQEK